MQLFACFFLRVGSPKIKSNSVSLRLPPLATSSLSLSQLAPVDITTIYTHRGRHSNLSKHAGPSTKRLVALSRQGAF